ncbi:MAG: EAL domain-containing protein, partial [Kangiellaceae bacterium]|nr:EAL domain-containing protein [Kangiellaceae bacterium]
MKLKKKLYLTVAIAISLLISLAVSAVYIRDSITSEAISIQKQVNQNQLRTREAQVHFKIQVQEWKNILIRGSEPNDFERYYTGFERQEQLTQQEIKGLINKLEKNSQAVELAKTFLEQHTKLGDAYRKALLNYNSEGSSRIDAKVRGIDRKPTELLSNVVDKVAEEGSIKLAQLDDELSRSQLIIYSFILVTLICSSWLIISLAKKLAAELTTDPTTLLSNRREMIRSINYRLKRNKSFTMLLVDIDQFKLINEVCGHLGADNYLKSIADILQSKSPRGSLLFRSNADEFIVLIDKVDADYSTKLAEAVRSKIEMYEYHHQGNTFKATSSVAVIDVDKEYHSIESLFTAIDLTMQEVKESGRNRIIYYSQLHQGIADRQRQMRSIHELHSALKVNRLALYKQKIEAVNDEHQSHYEILLRMIGSDGNIISPGIFLPAAEKYNIANKVDRWVIRTLSEYLSSHPNDTNHYSVNLSGATLSDPTFIPFVQNIFKLGQFSSERIGFEITETEAVKHLDIAKSIISTLKEFGCKIALDDFGTGVSSF